MFLLHCIATTQKTGHVQMSKWPDKSTATRISGVYVFLKHRASE